MATKETSGVLGKSQLASNGAPLAKPSADLTYLNAKVYTALRSGITETIFMVPEDPVEYLGLWLRNWVKTQHKYKAMEQELIDQEDREKRARDEENVRQIVATNLHDDRQRGFDFMSVVSDNPFLVLQTAVDLIRQFTAADGVYLALIEDPLDTDDDILGLNKKLPKKPKTPQEEPDEDIPPPKPKLVDGFDYSGKALHFLCVDKDHEYIKHTRLLPDLDQYPPHGGASFECLRTKTRCLDFPVALNAPGVRFFNSDKYPLPGALFASTIVLRHNRERVGILYMDTLKTPARGSGQAFSDADKEWFIEVCLKIEDCFEQSRERRENALRQLDSIELLLGQAWEVHTGQKLKPPSTTSSTKTKSGHNKAGSKTGTPKAGVRAAPATPQRVPLRAPRSKEQRAKEKAEEEAAARLKALQEKSPEELKFQEGVLNLNCARTALNEIRSGVLAEIKGLLRPPKAHFRMLKAILYIMGKTPEECREWSELLPFFTVEMIQNMVILNSEQPREADWTRSRQILATFTQQDIEKESQTGLLLYKWVTATLLVNSLAQTVKDHQAKREEDEMKLRQEFLSDTPAVQTDTGLSSGDNSRSNTQHENLPPMEGVEPPPEPAQDASLEQVPETAEAQP